MTEWNPPERLEVTETNLSSLETNIPCDPHELEVQQADYASQTYRRLSKQQRRELVAYLSDKYNNDVFNQVYDYLLFWKDPSKYDEQIGQSYERLVKETLEIPTDVRNGGKKAHTPSPAEVTLFSDLYIITQCFLAIHFGDRTEQASKNVYRGIREESIAALVAQAIDHPESNRYYFYTSTISNHTGLEGVAFHHSDGIIVNWDAPRDFVVFAPDRLFNTPSHEDEFQLVGGCLWVDADGVLHEGTQSGQTRRLQTVAQSMESPEDLGDVDHKDIADLVEMMYHNEKPIITTEGANRLRDWWREIDTRELFSPKKRRLLKMYVDYLIEMGKDEQRRENVK